MIPTETAGISGRSCCVTTADRTAINLNAASSSAVKNGSNQVRWWRAVASSFDWMNKHRASQKFQPRANNSDSVPVIKLEPNAKA